MANVLKVTNLFILSLALQMGCAKKNNTAKTLETRKRTQSEKVIPAAEVPEVKTPIAKTPEAEVPAATRPQMELEDQQVIQPPALVSVEQETPKVQVPEKVEMQLETPKVQSSDVAEPAALNLRLQNISAILKLAENDQWVLYQGKRLQKVSAKDFFADKNEEHFCSVQANGNLKDNEPLKLVDNALKQTDVEADLYQTQLEFKNSSGKLIFACDHTTNNFFAEDFAINFKDFFQVLDFEGKPLKLEGHVNPRTERRQLNAVKLKNIEILEKIVLDEKSKEAFGLSEGGVDSLDKLSNLVAGGTKSMTCVVAEKQGEFLKDTVYIRVDKGVAQDTPREIPTATMYATYRADANHYFIVTCLMKKSDPWGVMMKATDSAFEFGVLDRTSYNKKFDEIKALHQQAQKRN